VEAAQWLDELRRAGKIRHVAATNFDRARLDETTAAGVPVVAHQVQYSVLDRRPAGEMAAACAARQIGAALLRRPAASSGPAISGSRRHARHLTDTLAACRLALTSDDRAAIAAVHAAAGPQGDVYGLERIKGGAHASIMRYTLNRDALATSGAPRPDPGTR
jgi:aryl-alcohol dehydrogenase-like predicted oxidoreductase